MLTILWNKNLGIVGWAILAWGLSCWCHPRDSITCLSIVSYQLELSIGCQLQCLFYWCLQHGWLKIVVLPTYWASQAEFLVNNHSKRLRRKLHGPPWLSLGCYSVLFSQNLLYKTITCLPELRKGDIDFSPQWEECLRFQYHP